jgi:hypothetical protein
MPEKYINPFTDFGFKKLFGEEANKDLLCERIERREGGRIERREGRDCKKHDFGRI